jgi:tubby-related protein 1
VKFKFIKIKCLFGLKVRYSNLEHQSHILDFKGRVKRISIKNFQIVKDDDIILQFGRSGDDIFIMDFKFPFTPLQAFAVCLSSIDKKYGCQ